MSSNVDPSLWDALRARAEASLAARGAPEHEFEIQQIELKMQFESLQAAHSDLERAEAHSRALFDHAPAGYVTLDGAGRIGRANRRALNLLVSTEDLAAQPLSRFVHPTSQDALHRFRIALRDGHVPATCSVRLARDSDAVCWVRLDADAAGPLRDGGIEHLLALTDITQWKEDERRAAQRSRELSILHSLHQCTPRVPSLQARLRAFLDALLHALQVNAVGGYLRGHAGALTLRMHAGAWPSELRAGSRLPRTGVLGSVPRLRWPARQGLDGALEHEPVSRALRALGHRSCAAIPFVVSGEVLGVVLLAAYRPDALGEEALGLLGSIGEEFRGVFAERGPPTPPPARPAPQARPASLPPEPAPATFDIADRRALIRALREADALNATLLNALPLPLGVVDESGRTLFFNQAMKDEVGASGLGRPCWELYRDDGHQCAQCPLHDGVPAGETRTVQVHGVFGARTFEILHTGLTWRGRPAMLEVFYDVTARDAAGAARGERAQQGNPAGALGAGVAHDFNNLMSVILAHTELALEALGPEAPARADLTEVQRAAIAASERTRALMALLRDRQP
jgi:PAS domain S-box-containing protein